MAAGKGLNPKEGRMPVPHLSASRRVMGKAVPLLFGLALLQGASAFAQDAAPDKPETPEAAAARLADSYQLTNADGDRTCPVALAGKPVRPAGGRSESVHLFTVEIDRAACARQITFAADIAAWSPGPGDSIRLHAASGKLVAEFTEGVGGTWEALRDNDGVYFLVNPRLADPGTLAKPADLFGLWKLSANPDAPGCTVMFAEHPLPGGDYPLGPDDACAALFGDVAPERWRIDAGDLVLIAADGEQLRFAVQEDGSWSKVPEDRRPLLLSRTP